MIVTSSDDVKLSSCHFIIFVSRVQRVKLDLPVLQGDQELMYVDSLDIASVVHHAIITLSSSVKKKVSHHIYFVG